jgi:hypothetical protein
MSKEVKFAISLILWVLGSAIIGLLHYLTNNYWMQLFIVMLVIGWGFVCVQIYRHL